MVARRRRPNIIQALGQCMVFAGMLPYKAKKGSNCSLSSKQLLSFIFADHGAHLAGLADVGPTVEPGGDVPAHLTDVTLAAVRTVRAKHHRLQPLTQDVVYASRRRGLLSRLLHPVQVHVGRAGHTLFRRRRHLVTERRNGRGGPLGLKVCVRISAGGHQQSWGRVPLKALQEALVWTSWGHHEGVLETWWFSSTWCVCESMWFTSQHSVESVCDCTVVQITWSTLLCSWIGNLMLTWSTHGTRYVRWEGAWVGQVPLVVTVCKGVTLGYRCEGGPHVFTTSHWVIVHRAFTMPIWQRHVVVYLVWRHFFLHLSFLYRLVNWDCLAVTSLGWRVTRGLLLCGRSMW